ncbi:MAG TPA: hypothetical protein VE713_03665 [Pyrinomonadaceae bacterium]|jgi:uncharacterized protein YjbJ (UPF0337 family)|nr:hypothetical protein [Pyrinomonadaceae bacterium]
MAEERNLGLARAPEAAGDADSTKAELQRRMEEARESISQTVTEIKETVVNQYQQVRETISDTLDWREQYRRRPLPFTLGAFAVGALVGYSIMGAFKSDGYEDEDDFDEESADRAGRSYAAAPILGESHASTAYQRAASPASVEEDVEQYGRASDSPGPVSRAPASRPSYSSGYQASTAPQHAGAASGGAEEEEEEPKGPGLFERFKETKAYDKLTEELSTVGERVVEELSRTAQAVVVPMLLNKLKSLIGVDLSAQRQSQPRGLTGQQASQSGAGASAPSTSGAGVQGQSSGAGASSGAGGTGGHGAS